MNNDAERTARDEVAYLRTRSLGSVVIEELERLILGGEYPPGTKLRETAVAARLGVSRGPIREAFRHLQQQGLIDLNVNRGAVVRRIGVEEAVLLKEMRASLAPIVGGRAALGVTQADIDAMRKLVDEMDAVIETDNFAQYYPLNLRFHTIVLECTRCPRLISVISAIDKELYLLQWPRERDSVSQSNAEHRRIFEALRAREVEKVAAEFTEHVASGLARTKKNWEAATSKDNLALTAKQP